MNTDMITRLNSLLKKMREFDNNVGHVDEDRVFFVASQEVESFTDELQSILLQFGGEAVKGSPEWHLNQVPFDQEEYAYSVLQLRPWHFPRIDSITLTNERITAVCRVNGRDEEDDVTQEFISEMWAHPLIDDIEFEGTYTYVSFKTPSAHAEKIKEILDERMASLS